MLDLEITFHFVLFNSVAEFKVTDYVVQQSCNITVVFVAFTVFHLVLNQEASYFMIKLTTVLLTVSRASQVKATDSLSDDNDSE